MPDTETLRMTKERAELVIKILNKLDKICNETGKGNIRITVDNYTVFEVRYETLESTNYNLNEK